MAGIENVGNLRRGDEEKSQTSPLEEAVPQAGNDDLRGEYLRLAEERIKVIEDRGPQARDQVGKLFDVSGRSVQAAKTVLEHGTEEEIKSVESGEAALTPTEQKIRERDQYNRPAQI